MTTSKRKAGRPKAEKQGKRHSIYIGGELTDRLDAYIARQPYPPAVSAVIARALERLIDEDEKRGGKR